MAEVQRLRKQLNTSCFGCNDATSKAEKKPVDTGRKKAFQSLVKNLKGDLGVNSSDSKHRKSDILVNARRAEALKQAYTKEAVEVKLRGKAAGEF